MFEVERSFAKNLSELQIFCKGKIHLMKGKCCKNLEVLHSDWRVTDRV